MHVNFSCFLTSSGMLTVTKESSLSSHPVQDVSGSKMYVLFGMKVTMLLSLVQFSTSFDLISLQKTKQKQKQKDKKNIHALNTFAVGEFLLVHRMGLQKTLKKTKNYKIIKNLWSLSLQNYDSIFWIA